MKDIINATYHLMFFKTYTDMPRWMEILYGIAFWAGVAIIIFSQISIWT